MNEERAMVASPLRLSRVLFYLWSFSFSSACFALCIPPPHHFLPFPSFHSLFVHSGRSTFVGCSGAGAELVVAGYNDLKARAAIKGRSARRCSY